MNYPDSEHLGVTTGPGGRRYSFHFYGKNEGAAVINVEAPLPEGRAEELHRESAANAEDAATKLTAWWNGDQEWPQIKLKRGSHCAGCGKEHQFERFTGQRVYWSFRGDGTVLCPDCAKA
jgi:hypothetical protein